jgi:predicted enzyme related to lactoylglutathione lyase
MPHEPRLPIVWHDLMTREVAPARRFYAALLGWTYRVEHAAVCAWTGQEADYPLILAQGQAHGGFVDPGRALASRWIPFVQVTSVDATVTAARARGATVEWEPFDVPGVGRNAVLRDPQGAIVCPHAPTHAFPPPHGVFLADALLTHDVGQANAFYQDVFGWTVDGCTWVTPAGDAAWVPVLATENVAVSVPKAHALGAREWVPAPVRSTPDGTVLLRDPTGAVFGLDATGSRARRKPPPRPAHAIDGHRPTTPPSEGADSRRHA